jgi:hypothetical protein
MVLALAPGVAWACGGFFCDGGGTVTSTYTVPVAQSGERILFRVNPDETVTTFVEVAYTQDEDMDFAWVIPIPATIDTTSITTASAELLNALESATAPTFLFQYPPTGGYYGGYYDYAYYDDTAGCGGCACGASAKLSSSGSAVFTSTGTASSMVTVSVVDEAVVGPFAVEVITAEDGAGFAEWLADNGYDLPPGADAALQHYLDLDMAFLGVKLAPDVPAGPIETLEFTYPAQMPMIPLILTAIASVDDLPITAWVLADEPWIVAGGWGIARDVADETRPDGSGSDYLDRVAAEIDRFDGKAMMLEFSGPVADLPADLRTRAFVDGHTWLVRWRGDISPWQMTVDPEFVPEAGLPAYDNVHAVTVSGTTPMSRIGRAGLALAPALWLAGWWRRRRGQRASNSG